MFSLQSDCTEWENWKKSISINKCSWTFQKNTCLKTLGFSMLNSLELEILKTVNICSAFCWHHCFQFQNIKNLTFMINLALRTRIFVSSRGFFELDEFEVPEFSYNNLIVVFARTKLYLTLRVFRIIGVRITFSQLHFLH